MLNLIKKELTLAVSPSVYLFALLSFMLAIPNYPSWVGIFYCFIAVNISFTVARVNKDLEFSMLLPLPRRHIVLGKCFNVIYSELIQLLFAIPGALIAVYFVYPSFGGNPVGMDANLAFFGMVLIAYTVFNLVFLPYYFKSGYKSGVALLFGMLGFVFAVAVIEVVVNLVPTLSAVLDSESSATIGWRVLTLAVGIVVFVFGNYGAYRLSVKNFEKVSL